MQDRAVTESIRIADQPSEADLRALAGSGVRGVVNLRHDGEPEQPLPPGPEGDLVRSLGLDYLHVPVGGAPLDPAGVAAVADFLDRHTAEGQVLVHCRKGGRAAALVLLHLARRNGWTASQAVNQAAAIGLPLEGNLRLLVEQYLTQNPPLG
jgi:uncharacterized protein (TIGR01244 family)